MIRIDCDLCGKDSKLVYALVEGTRVNVCDVCSKYGKVIEAPKLKKKELKPEKPEVILSIVNDYNRIIKSSREKKSLKQEELAAAIQEKMSLIQKIESGHQKPSIALARKLEKFFNIALVEQLVQDEKNSVDGTQTPGLTIADFIRKR